VGQPSREIHGSGAALITRAGWRPLAAERLAARLIGVHVTLDGYKLFWFQSRQWVVQLPLDVQETAARCRSLYSWTVIVKHFGSMVTRIWTLSWRRSGRP